MLSNQEGEGGEMQHSGVTDLTDSRTADRWAWQCPSLSLFSSVYSRRPMTICRWHRGPGARQAMTPPDRRQGVGNS